MDAASAAGMAAPRSETLAWQWWHRDARPPVQCASRPRARSPTHTVTRPHRRRRARALVVPTQARTAHMRATRIRAPVQAFVSIAGARTRSIPDSAARADEASDAEGDGREGEGRNAIEEGVVPCWVRATHGVTGGGTGEVGAVTYASVRAGGFATRRHTHGRRVDRLCLVPHRV